MLAMLIGNISGMFLERSVSVYESLAALVPVRGAAPRAGARALAATLTSAARAGDVRHWGQLWVHLR